MAANTPAQHMKGIGFRVIWVQDRPADHLEHQRSNAMNRIAVESSNIQSVGYDHTKRVLEVEFQSGAVYQYRGVMPLVYTGLLAAPSKGAFLNRCVKGAYPYERIDDTGKPSIEGEAPKLSKVQELYLELIRGLSFNSCEGERVVADLKANADLWVSAIMLPAGGPGLILRDLADSRDEGEGVNNVDTLYIFAPDQHAMALVTTAFKLWGADDVNVYTWKDSAESRYGRYNLREALYQGQVVIEVWWD